PPGKLLLLHLDRSPEWVELKPGTKEITLEAGSHVLLPLDRGSQQALENLRQGLEYLPLDYEITLLNVLRRPSLEWRVSRLERAVQPEQPARDRPNDRAGANILTTPFSSSRFSVFRLAVIFLLLVLAIAAYFLVWPHTHEEPRHQKATTLTKIIGVSSVS